MSSWKSHGLFQIVYLKNKNIFGKGQKSLTLWHGQHLNQFSVNAQESLVFFEISLVSCKSGWHEISELYSKEEFRIWGHTSWSLLHGQRQASSVFPTYVITVTQKERSVQDNCRRGDTKCPYSGPYCLLTINVQRHSDWIWGPMESPDTDLWIIVITGREWQWDH